MALQGRREREERQEKEAVKLNSNISKIKIQALFGYGALPHRPTKGLSFSFVCFCHWQQQPKTSLETFGHKYLAFLEISVLLA